MFKRFLLAFALIFLIMTLWNQLGVYLGYVPKGPQQSLETASDEDDYVPPDEEVETGDQIKTSEEVAEQEPAEAAPVVVEETVERQVVVLENDQLYLELDNMGGIISRARLKQFYNTAKKLENVQLVRTERHSPGQTIIEGMKGAETRTYRVENPAPNQVDFILESADLTVRKSYTLNQGYKLGYTVSVSGLASDTHVYTVVAEGLQPLGPTDKMKPSLMDFGAINPKIMKYAWSEAGDHESKFVNPKKLSEDEFSPVPNEGVLIDWAGVKDNYFAAVFLPDEPQPTAFVKITEKYFNQTDNSIHLPVVAFESDTSLSGNFYLGPLVPDDLVQADPRLDNLISFGWAGLLSKWLFIGLAFIHRILGNWGWAILVLTLLIRLLLVPLTIPSVKSSFKMRKIQPKIDKLRQKYSGKDLESKQKLQQETFKLYKEEGVNPFSSCFTALAQMPVFFAYFSLLRSSIYLRQADWMFWIQDLSVKDPTYVLPIIMGATMFFSTMAMPMPSADPAQAKMMKFMPVMFSLMFIGMPAGLIIYMITSNIFTLGQTKILQWRYKKI